MRESDLYPTVRDWLQKQGYTVYIEIFDADIVAVKGDKVIAVELKTGFTSHLVAQLHNRARWADEVWAAVPVNMDGRLNGARYYGYGVLQIQDGRMRIRAHARPQPWHRIKARTYRMKKLAAARPALAHHVAGLPGCPLAAQQRRELPACILSPAAAPLDRPPADGIIPAHVTRALPV